MDYKTKRKIAKLKEEIADLRQNYKRSMFQGRRNLMGNVKKKSSMALEDLEHIMQDKFYHMKRQAKRHPAMAIALLAGVSALIALCCNRDYGCR